MEYLATNPSYLVKHSEIGKVKPSLYNLPGDGFTYGKPSGGDKDGAKELLSSWQFHKPSKDSIPEKDFKKLNKHSVKEGQYTAKHFSTFRKTQDMRLKINRGNHAIVYMLPDDEFSYGVPNRPSTPVINVLSHEYGLQSESIAKEIYQKRIMEVFY